MKVHYSLQLMEESVFRHLNHLERSGLRADYDEYHSLADPIYELPEDDREEAFEKVNELFFREKLNLGDHVLKALEACGPARFLLLCLRFRRLQSLVAGADARQNRLALS